MQGIASRRLDSSSSSAMTLARTNEMPWRGRSIMASCAAVANLNLLAVVVLLTHVLASAFTTFFLVAAIPSWIARAVIAGVSVRMFFVRERDNSSCQELIMVCCFWVSAVDLFWAWLWLDESVSANFENGEWAKAFSQLPAALAALYAAKVHIPSDILEDRRRFTALLMIVTHGMAFFFGASFYPGIRWLAYLAGALFSVRLLVTKVEDVNLALGSLAIVFCALLVAADLWITVWCVSPGPNISPAKWVTVFPNAAAACASIYTTGTLVQDRRVLANILITV